MKKTIREYLTECRDMACHNVFCYSATYMMDTPRAGYEAQFAEAQRDIEIVDELIALVEECPTSDDPDVDVDAIQTLAAIRAGIQKYGLPDEVYVDTGSKMVRRKKDLEVFELFGKLLKKHSQRVLTELLGASLIQEALKCSKDDFEHVLSVNMSSAVDAIIGRVQRDFVELIK